MQMRQNAIRGLVAIAALAVPVAGMAGQEPAGRREITVTGTQLAELRRTDQLIDALERIDELVLTSRSPDRYLPDRVHEGFMQYHDGVPVLGGGLSRQLAGGVTVSVFGTLVEGLEVDTTPLVAADDALALIAQRSGAGPATGGPPSLVIAPTLVGDYVLAWRMPMDDRQTYFLDAHGGGIVHRESNVFEQSASVGVGDGIQGQRKKLSTSEGGGRYQAYDRLRPAEIVTLDMRHDTERADFLVDEPEGVWLPSDVASDPNNDWDDRAVVDAHAYLGFTYDYLALQQGWNGLDGENGRVIGMVNIGLDYHNAFWAPPPYGPEGTGVVAFGHEVNGTPIVSADVVAHEVMHGVTHWSMSARTGEGFGLGPVAFLGAPAYTLASGLTIACGERYTYPDDAHPSLAGRSFSFLCADGGLILAAGLGLAVNEAYSDVIGTAVEFMLHEPPTGPLRADYLISEDSGPPLRSLADPGSITLHGRTNIPRPDHFSQAVWFLIQEFEDDDEFVYFSSYGSVDGGRTLVFLGSFDYPGQHWNSNILSHAFYLAVEGGRNRTSGLTVEGVGGANRRDVERAFFRAMTDLMPNHPHMATAALAIVQSAADLFGPDSATVQAIGQAMVGVGLLRPAGS